MRFGWITTLSVGTDSSFWKNLWNTVFADETNYEYLEKGAVSLTSLRMIIVGNFIGLALACFAAVFNKRVLGDFVRKVLREEALSPETAKTLSELGYERNTCIRSSVRKGVNLRRVVRCREEEAYLLELEQKQAEYEEKRKENPKLPKFKAESFRVNADEHHFYIPEEMKYMADVKFEKRGSTWLGAIVFIVVLLILAVVLFLTLPYILTVLNDWFGAVESVFSYKNKMI